MSAPSPGLIGVIGAAITTAIVGNFLVQWWQRRNWFEQQRQLIYQQELSEIKELFDSLSGRADARLHAMRSLVGALEAGKEKQVDAALKEYRTQLKVWNGSLRSQYPLITLYYRYETTLEYERDVHGGFVTTGQLLDIAVRLFQRGRPPPPATLAQIRHSLNVQAGRLSKFYLTLIDGLKRRRTEVLHGRRHRYTNDGLNHFTISELIKALFASDVDGFDVVRPA